MEKAVLPLSPHSHILLLLRKGLGRVSAYMVLDTHTLGVIVRKLQHFAVSIIHLRTNFDTNQINQQQI